MRSITGDEKPVSRRDIGQTREKEARGERAEKGLGVKVSVLGGLEPGCSALGEKRGSDGPWER